MWTMLLEDYVVARFEVLCISLQFYTVFFALSPCLCGGIKNVTKVNIVHMYDDIVPHRCTQTE